MMAVQIGKDQGPNLATVFDSVWKSFVKLIQSELCTSSEEIQVWVVWAILYYLYILGQEPRVIRGRNNCS